MKEHNTGEAARVGNGWKVSQESGLYPIGPKDDRE